MSREKSMYQIWLIIQGLPAEEKKLIPKDFISEIEENMEEDENIKIDFNIPLEKQNLDEYTWEKLGEMIEIIDEQKTKENSKEVDIDKEELKKIKLQNTKLTEQIQNFKNSSRKIFKEYQNIMEKYKNENINLKNNCEILTEFLNGLPKVIRKFFIKDDRIYVFIKKEKDF